MAGSADLLRAVELGLHAVAALVRAGIVAGNPAAVVAARSGKVASVLSSCADIVTHAAHATTDTPELTQLPHPCVVAMIIP